MDGNIYRHRHDESFYFKVIYILLRNVTQIRRLTDRIGWNLYLQVEVFKS